MDYLQEKYTTNEKVEQEAKNPEIKEKIEATKTVISNDAYAMAEIFGQSLLLMSKNIQNLIRSFAK